MESGNKIQRLQKGAAPSLIDTQKGNELIDRINAICNLITVPSGGTLKVGADGSVLDLSQMLETALGQYLERILSSQEFLDTLERIIEEKLANARFTLICDPSGEGGTITLTVS